MVTAYPLLLISIIITSHHGSSSRKNKDKNTDKNTLVRTTEGDIEGIERDGIIQFIGIPFAKPPTDELRFEPPQSLQKRPQKDVFDATQTLDSVPVCPQIWEGSISGDEDCLYLNIFAPSKSNKNRNKKLPVMLWIFGGRFLFGGGSSSLYDPTNWLNNPKANDVIIVTVNYRLGALGFLYDNTELESGIEGNYGYLDVLQATKWVYDNIKSFGGDPKNIITFGQSSGSYLAMIQLLYNSEYIKGSILQSPNIQIPLRDPVTWYNTFETFTDSVGCTSNSTISTCLKDASVEHILLAQDATFTIPGISTFSVYGAPYPGNDWAWPVPWGPTALTDTIPNQILYEFEDGIIETPPFIIGTVRDEQYFTFSDDLIGLDFSLFVANIAFAADGVNVFIEEPVLPTTAPITFSILGYYGIDTGTSLTGDFQNDLLEILTDYWYCATRNILKNIDDATNVYYYNFDYNNQQTNTIYNDFLAYDGCSDKVCHGVDLFYEWQAPLLQSSFDNDTIAMGETLQQLFTDYANNFKIPKKIWAEYTNDNYSDSNFLRILGPDELIKESTFTSGTRLNTNPISSENGLCDFWDSIGYLYGSERANISYDESSNARIRMNNEIDDDELLDETESDNDENHQDWYDYIGYGVGGIIMVIIACLMIIFYIICKYKETKRLMLEKQVKECDDDAGKNKNEIITIS